MQYRVYDRRKLAYIDGGYVVDYNIDDDYIVNNNSSISIVKETNAVEGDIIVLIKNSGPFHKGVITSVDNADLTISYKSDKQLFNDNMPNIKSADFAADSELTVAGKLGLKEVAEILKIVFPKKTRRNRTIITMSTRLYLWILLRTETCTTMPESIRSFGLGAITA